MKIQLKELLMREISELGAPQRAIHCTSQTSVAEAVLLLRKEKIGSVVIVDDKKVMGIFTERDLVDKVPLNGGDLSKLKVSEFMTPNPGSARRHESIGEVMLRMRKGRYRHIVLVDAYGHLEKVISNREIMDYLVEPMLVDAKLAA